MITQKKTLKKWFSNFMKPAQEHFSAWIDSYWHKSEQIPMSNIEGLSKAFENTASAGQLLNHTNDTNAHRNLFDKKVDKEEGKGLSANDFTNEHKQKLEELQPTDVSGLLPKGGYDGTGQQLKEAINGLKKQADDIETKLYDNPALEAIRRQIDEKMNKKPSLEKLAECIDISKEDYIDEPVIGEGSARKYELLLNVFQNIVSFVIESKNSISIKADTVKINEVDVLSEIKLLKEEIKLLKNNS